MQGICLMIYFLMMMNEETEKQNKSVKFRIQN